MNENGNDHPFPLNYLHDLFQFIVNKLLRISTLLILISDIFWITTAFFSLKKYNDKYRNDLKRFAYITFGINMLNSCMSLTEIFQENVMISMRTLLELLQSVLALPALTTEVWLKYEVAQKEIAWLHTIIGLIPTYIFLFQHYTRQDLVDFTVVLNIMSLMAVGVLYRDVYVVGSAVCIFLSYCVFFFRNDISEAIPRQCYNYCMAAFTICAYRSVM